MYAVIRDGVNIDGIYARDTSDAARILKRRGYDIVGVQDGYGRYNGAFIVN